MSTENTLVDLLTGKQSEAAQALAAPGDWLTGTQRLEAWEHVRDSATNQLDAARLDALSPNAVTGSHPAGVQLSAEAVEVVRRIASDPGRLTRTWANQMIEALGEETYTELVGVTAIAMVLDRFNTAMGVAAHSLPPAQHGDPTQVRPDGVGDIGAWVSQDLDDTQANVRRSLSLVPVTNQAWRSLADSHYSRGAQFLSLHWDRALSRPQVELVAARTTALNQCFY